MKQPFGCAVFLILLCGCGGKPANDAVAVMESAGTRPSATPIVATEPMSTPLPEGFTLRFAYHPLRDVITPRENDRRASRRVEFEILEGDPVDAFDSITASMREAGFKVHSGPTVEGAVVRGSFSREGYGVVHVRAQAESADGSEDPAATGFVVMAW